MRLGILSNTEITSRSAIKGVVDDILHINKDCDVLVVAGNFAERPHVSLGLLKLSFEKPVIYVPGPLELDGTRRDVNEWLTDIQARRLQTNHSVMVLHNSVDYHDMTVFIGASLCLDPNKIAPVYKYKEPYNSKEWCAVSKQMHDDAVDFLQESIRPSGIVVSYYPPIKEVLPLNILGTELTTILSANISFDEHPRLWICSAPEAIDVDIDSTRYVANPYNQRMTSKIVVV
jgi:hypothetical protein